MNSVAECRPFGPGDFREQDAAAYSSAERPAEITARPEVGGSVCCAAAGSISNRNGSADSEVATAEKHPELAATAGDMGRCTTSRTTIGGGAIGGSGDRHTPFIVGDGSTGLRNTMAGLCEARCETSTSADGSRATGASKVDAANDHRAGFAPGDAAVGGLKVTELAIPSTTGTLFRLARQLAFLAVRLSKTSTQDAETALVGIIDSLISCVHTLRPCPHVSDSGRQSAIRLSVERYVERNLSSSDLSPESISHGLGIPRSTLYGTFTDVGGIVRYIHDQRLAAAKSLLLHPEEHRFIGEIADSVGFINAATFSRKFRRQFGCSPRDMRRRGMQLVGVMRHDRHEIGPR